MKREGTVPGDVYHIFNRGVEKRNIFNNDKDRWRFLQGLFLFNDVKKIHNLLYHLERDNGRMNFNILRDFVNNNNEERDPLVRIMADCLMPNHFHLIVQELKEGGITAFMQRFGTGYTKYFNEKNTRVGSLFQGPYKVVPVKTDMYLKYLLVYINIINPGQLIEPNLKEDGVKDIDRIMEFAENFDWSTNKEYLGLRESIIIDKGLLGEFFENPEEYKKFARDVLKRKKYDEINDLTLE